ncbi:hemicentin-2-like [Asterias amurensis]|uniref:hemicentin-2-like n=1 Tax=Asterias amurensis TaxID=7602 RepID=UPI003AB3AA6C
MWTKRMCLIVELSLLWVFCGFMATEGITVDPQRRMTILQGTPNVEMTCPVQRWAVRPVIFEWFYLPNDADMATPIDANSTSFVTSGTGQLTVDQVNRTDSGVFTAIATDSTGGSGNCTFYLEVGFPPVFDNETITEIQGDLNQTVVLTCPYESSPLSTVTWLKDGVILEFSTRFIIDGRNLTIADVQAADKGSYQCRASNTYGMAVSSPIILVMEVTPLSMEFLVTPDSVSIFIAGENGTLTCSVRGSPRPTVEWTKNSMAVINTQLLTVSETFVNGVVKSTIEYTSVELDDRGTYSCSARNADQAVNHLFEVVVYVPPVITSVFESILRVQIGQPMTLLCRANALPKASFTWYKDDRPISRVAETHFQEGWDGYLRVKEVIGSDAGLYQCRAVNEVGEAFSKSFTIVVTGLHFLVKPRPNMYIVTNATAQVDCSVAGSQNNIDIEWRKNGLPVTTTCTESHFNNSLCTGTFRVGNSLFIKEMSLEDEGLYSCVASERGTKKTITADTRINVLVPVKIEPPLPTKMKGDFHRGLTVRCNATGVPTPKIEWLRHGVHVINNTYRTVIDGMMQFRALHVADAGHYTCVASNKAGEVAQNMQIVVNTILTTPAALNITVNPKSRIAQVKWSIIANGGYRVTSFNLEYRKIKPDVTVWTVYENVPANQRTMGIKELDSEALYEVKVWANNQLGKGEVSTIEFKTTVAEAGGILELSMSQLIIIAVIIVAAFGMLLAIICVIIARRRSSNPSLIRGGEDNQALVHNQQDSSSHSNPAYMQGGTTDRPQKDMELKEVKQNESNGGGNSAGSGSSAATEQNGKAKKATTTT